MPAVETKLLESAFQEFSRASDSIVNYYTLLENQIKQLKKEIEEKNSELERAKKYLHTILDSLPLGVVVAEDKTILFSNSKAETLGSMGFLNNLNNGVEKAGQLRNGRSHYRWKKEILGNGFTGKEVIVFEDVTEAEKTKERLEREERLMAMGEMAARIAHEVKNPLGSMELFLSMLLNGRLRAKEKKYVEYVQYGVKTIDRIINNLLSYTRPKALVPEEGKLSGVVKDTLDFMAVSIRSRDIGLEFYPYFDGFSFFDPDMMKLVIMNFVSNAIEAINGHKGLIKIEIREEGKYVLLVVTDNGVGMSDEVKRNVFNPFFTTKEKGVGLGLFIVYNIMKAHGGYIEVESTEGSGSSFFIYVPRDRNEISHTYS